MFGCVSGALPMTETCDLCHSSTLEPIYEPETSPRGLTVHLCSDCGLVQSLPRAVGKARSSAARDNVHFSKPSRTEACVSLIRAHADLDSCLCVLHTGSNRGPFARALLNAAPAAMLTSVGPDEDGRLLEAHFDIVYSCRTIAQRVSPASTLADHWRVLKPGGVLIVDAPNIEEIGSDGIAEEWFIDNHLYHFSRRTLARLLEIAGFETVAGADSRDRENLLLAARKRNKPTRSGGRDLGEVDAALALIASYVTARVGAQRAA
jgi:SAM-dependent methyltransferase